MAEDWRQTISWEHNDEWPFRWVPRLVEKLRERHLVPIDTSHIWISSDYSGAQHSSRFFLIGVLIADAGNLTNWQMKRVALRQQFLNDGRRMSFKNLNDGNRRAALIPFLDAADEIRGLSIVFAVDKRIQHFGGFDGFHHELKERNIILGNWKSLSFGRMITVTHIISVLLGMVTKEGQNVTWISDADDMFATELHRRDCARMKVKREVKNIALPVESPALHLLREADAPHQVIKSRVGAQGVKAGIDLEIYKSHIMRIIRLLQPFKRFLFLA